MYVVNRYLLFWAPELLSVFGGFNFRSVVNRCIFRWRGVVNLFCHMTVANQSGNSINQLNCRIVVTCQNKFTTPPQFSSVNDGYVCTRYHFVLKFRIFVLKYLCTVNTHILKQKRPLVVVSQIIYDEEERCFYMLCNRFAMKTGIYLIKFDENDP